MGGSPGETVQLEIGDTHEPAPHILLHGILSFLCLPQYTPEPGLFGSLQVIDSNCSANLLVRPI